MVELLEQLVSANLRNSDTTGSEEDWHFLTSEMNAIVPPKTVSEWKIVISCFNHTSCQMIKRSYSYLQHFDTMKFNIQGKVRTILECGGSLEDNMSDDELKIYRMIPHITYSEPDEWSYEQEETVNENEQRDANVAVPSNFDLPIVLGLDLPVVLDLELPVVLDLELPVVWDSDLAVVTDKPRILVEPHSASDPQSANTISTDHSRQESLDAALDDEQEAEINEFQNTKLIDLLQHFFLLTVGRSSKVNGVKIDESTWNVLVGELNTLGPSINAFEWKIVIPSLNVHLVVHIKSNNFIYSI